MKDLVFLLYDNRSGSTYLSALLNRFEGVSVSQETDFVFQILEYSEKEILTEDQLLRLAEYLFELTRFPELGMTRDAFFDCFSNCRFPLTKREIISQVLENYFVDRDPDAILWVVKGPRTFFHLHTLNQSFPKVRYIQIVRDGRAVYSSKSRTQKYDFEAGQFHQRAVMDNNLLHAARKWRQKLHIAEKYGDKVVNVRYEDLLHDPCQTVGCILDTLQVPEGLRSLTKLQEDYTRDIFSDHVAVHTNVNKPTQESYADKWRNLLSKEQIFVYERINGDYLRSYGYDISELDKEQELDFKIRSLLMMAYYATDDMWNKLWNVVISIFVYRSFSKLFRQKQYELASDEAG